MEMVYEDMLLLEQYWVQKSSKNFFAFRQYIRANNFLHGHFLEDMAQKLTQFYLDWRDGNRPILVIEAPPQHGKSWAITDFIAWMIGRHPDLRTIYASFSKRLGARCNASLKRYMDGDKYQKIFPNLHIPARGSRDHSRNNELIEFLGEDGEPTDGYFRNTTVGGPVTGETLDLGVIDDPLKGRKEASSETVREGIWDWYTDDFSTRFSDTAGLIIVMTRWHLDDLVGKLKAKKGDTVKVVKYPAIATADEKHRKESEPLFPELKPLDFLLDKKSTMRPANFQSVYQGSPTVVGGDMFKDHYWKWWTRLPQLKYKFIVADTAQQIKTHNDWTCFQCWGYGIDNCIYLLDIFHAKLESPELRKEAYAFYKKHDTPRKRIDDPILRAFHIEDKSSGSGLIQELKRKKVKVKGVQRNIDKVFRADDAIPEIESGKVYLNEDIPHIGVLTEEARHFPNGVHDDVIDPCMTAIEIALINNDVGSSLMAAMEA